MICLTVIARNEARCIARCLRSAAPYVDAMIVVDTGSTDDTRAIAAACGAQVAEFAWCEDFSAARNYALALTDARWRLVLDADEWIVSGGAALRAAAAADDCVGEILIRSAFDDCQAVRYAASLIARFLPRGPRFQGPIHEQIVHALPVRRLAVVVGHDGYQRAQQAAKGDRNERLLRRQLQATPHNPYVHYQLGKDLQVHERHVDACAAYAQARAWAGWPAADVLAAAQLRDRYRWLHDLVVREIFCLKRAGQFDAAQARVAAESRWWQQSPDFCFTTGDLLLALAAAQPQRAAELLPKIEASWLRCLALGEAPHLEGAVEGRGSHLAAHNLAVLYELTGQGERAQAYRALVARSAQPAGPGACRPGSERPYATGQGAAADLAA